LICPYLVQQIVWSANWASSVFSRLPASAASATLVGASLRIRSPSAIRLIVKLGG
jgi:hypothetical protein